MTDGKKRKKKCFNVNEAIVGNCCLRAYIHFTYFELLNINPFCYQNMFVLLFFCHVLYLFGLEKKKYFDKNADDRFFFLPVHAMVKPLCRGISDTCLVLAIK